MPTPPYTVTLEGHTFTANPAVEWSCQREHDESVTPVVHGLSVYTIRLTRCRLRSTGPGDAVDDLGTFLLATLHKRVVPTALQIKDAAGNAIDEVGEISTTGGWEDLEVLAFDLPPGVQQLLAGVEFELTVRAVKPYPGASGLVYLHRRYTETTGEDGVTIKRLDCRGRCTIASGATYETAAIASQLRLAAPAGWLRTRGNTSSGFDVVAAPRWPLQHVFETLSEVKAVGGGIAPPTRSGDASYGTSRQDDLRLGLETVTTFADVTGPSSSSAADWVDGKSPDGAVLVDRTVDEAKRSARGSWATVEAPDGYLRRRTLRVEVRRQLRHGGAGVEAVPLTGGFRPLLRRTAEQEWRLTETQIVFALAPESLADMPGLQAPPGKWILDPRGSWDGLPEIERPGPDRAQRVWSRTSQREWVWGGDELAPLDHEPFVRALVAAHEPGETDGLIYLEGA